MCSAYYLHNYNEPSPPNFFKKFTVIFVLFHLDVMIFILHETALHVIDYKLLYFANNIQELPTITSNYFIDRYY